MLAPLFHGPTAGTRRAVYEQVACSLEYEIACCGLERLYQRFAINRRQYLDGVADAFMKLMRELTR